MIPKNEWAKPISRWDTLKDATKFLTEYPDMKNPKNAGSQIFQSRKILLSDAKKLL